MCSMDSDDQVKKEAFREMIVAIQLLRSKGFSFDQLSDFLKECDIELSAEMVCCYFEEMFFDGQEERLQQMERMSQQRERMSQQMERMGAILNNMVKHAMKEMPTRGTVH